MKDHMYSQNAIAGHFAMWAVRQSPYPVPDNLGKVILALTKYIRKKFEAEIECEDTFIFKAYESEIRNLLDEFVKSNIEVQEWNEPKSGHTSQIIISSRYGQPKADDDIIDLDALIGNIFRSLHQEIENNEEFDREFDEEWEREQNRN